MHKNDHPARLRDSRAASSEFGESSLLQREHATVAHDAQRALRDPDIVHFAGSIKLWHPRFGGRSSTPWYAEWRQYARQTPYARELLGGSKRAVERALWSPLVRPADAFLRWRKRVR